MSPVHLTRARLVLITAVLLALLGGLATLWPGPQPQPAPGISLNPQDSGVVGQGRSLYAEHCASCHGVSLEGQPGWQVRRPDGKLPAPPHDESGHTWHHPDAVLFALTKYGPARVIGDPAYQSDMPGYDETLTDEQIIAVLSYIKSTWPQAIRDRHDQMNAQARRD